MKIILAIGILYGLGAGVASAQKKIGFQVPSSSQREVISNGAPPKSDKKNEDLQKEKKNLWECRTEFVTAGSEDLSEEVHEAQLEKLHLCNKAKFQPKAKNFSLGFRKFTPRRLDVKGRDNRAFLERMKFKKSSLWGCRQEYQQSGSENLPPEANKKHFENLYKCFRAQ